MMPRTRHTHSRATANIRLLTIVTIVIAALVAMLLPLYLLRLPDPVAPRATTLPIAAVPAPAPAPDDTPPLGSSNAAPAPPAVDAPANEHLTPTTQTVVPAEPASEPEPIIERRWVHTAPTATPAEVAPSEPPEDDHRSPLESARLKQRRAVTRFGGDERTEDAVETGLAWLAAHQEADGTWDRFGFNRHCPSGDRCAGHAIRRSAPSLDAGITGLTLLAFLGAGYTDREGPHQDLVARAVDALLHAQQAHGGFSSDESQAGYNDALATFALAEYVSLTGDERVPPALRRAVDRLIRSQQHFGGWDYLPRSDRGRNDSSISAWAIQALTSAQTAGVYVPPDALCRAGIHLARASESDGRVWYADSGTGFDLEAGTMRAVYRYGPAMTAAGAACEVLLGWRVDSPMLRMQRALLAADPPSEARMVRDTTSLHSYYYWYYGTLAMFQAGGESWERWNAQLRDAILPLQVRPGPTGRGHHSVGSWPPYGTGWGKWGRMGGRVYTTALCVLTLETYYRHAPAYLVETTPMTAGAWRESWAALDSRQQRWALEALRGSRVEIGEPILADLLGNEDVAIAGEAALALTELDSPLGMGVLERANRSATGLPREELSEALTRARALRARAIPEGEVRMYDSDRGLATLHLPQAYVGLLVDIRRDQQQVARMRIIQRFTARDVVVAELVAAEAEDAPRPGDRAAPLPPGAVRSP